MLTNFDLRVELLLVQGSGLALLILIMPVQLTVEDAHLGRLLHIALLDCLLGSLLMETIVLHLHLQHLFVFISDAMLVFLSNSCPFVEQILVLNRIYLNVLQLLKLLGSCRAANIACVLLR